MLSSPLRWSASTRPSLMNAPCSCWDSYRWGWHTDFPAWGGPCGLAFSLAASVRLLQVEVENFVLRVAAEFSSRKEQLVFLINNYDMMLGVLMVMPLLHGVPTTCQLHKLSAVPWILVVSAVWGGGRCWREGCPQVPHSVCLLRSELLTTAKRWRVSSSCSMLGHRWGLVVAGRPGCC